MLKKLRKIGIILFIFFIIIIISETAIYFQLGYSRNRIIKYLNKTYPNRTIVITRNLRTDEPGNLNYYYIYELEDNMFGLNLKYRFEITNFVCPLTSLYWLKSMVDKNGMNHINIGYKGFGTQRDSILYGYNLVKIKNCFLKKNYGVKLFVFVSDFKYNGNLIKRPIHIMGNDQNDDDKYTRQYVLGEYSNKLDQIYNEVQKRTEELSNIL